MAKKAEKAAIVRLTVDGREITLTEIEAKFLPEDKKLCAGGHSLNCRQGKPHKVIFPRTVSVYAAQAREDSFDRMRHKDRFYRTYELTLDESKAIYRCRRCGRHMGCKQCAETPTEMVCRFCLHWANKYGEEEHGVTCDWRGVDYDRMIAERKLINTAIPGQKNGAHREAL